MKIRIIYEAETPEEFSRAKTEETRSIHAVIIDLAYLARRHTTKVIARFAGKPTGHLVDVGLITTALQAEADYTWEQMEQAAGELRYAAAADNQAWGATLDTMIQMVEEAACGKTPSSNP